MLAVRETANEKRIKCNRCITMRMVGRILSLISGFITPTQIDTWCTVTAVQSDNIVMFAAIKYN